MKVVNLMKRINKWIDKNIINLILVFLFLQPIIDVVTAISLNIFNSSFTIGMVFRVFFLIFLTYYFIFIQKETNKKKTLLYLSVLGIYLLSFLVTQLYYKGFAALLYELQNMVRTFYFPISLVLLWNIFKEKKEYIDIKNYVRIMAIYLLFILIPNITHTGFASYVETKVGSIGWFNSGNEINGILSLFLPFAFTWIVTTSNNKKKVIITKIIYTIVLLYVCFSIGTKMVIISLTFVIGVYLITKIMQFIKHKKYKILSAIGTGLIIVCVLGFLFIPKTSFYKNIVIHLDYLGVTDATDILTNPKILDHFVFSRRLTFLNDTRRAYYDSSVTEKILGIGYIEYYGTDHTRIKNIEMDPFDIYYRHGPIGFLLFFAPAVYLGYVTLRLTKKDQEKELSSDIKSFYLSLILIVFMTIFTGHILNAPAVSIFVSIILVNQNANIYYNIRREE